MPRRRRSRTPAATAGPAPLGAATDAGHDFGPGLTRGGLRAACDAMERQDLRPGVVVGPASQISDLRRWGRDEVDSAAQREILASGQLGHLRTAGIHVSSREGSHEEAIVPTFEVASNPTISLSEIRARRFDVVDRQQVAAIGAIQAEEDGNIFEGLRAAVEGPGIFEPTITATEPVPVSEPYFGDGSRWEEI